MTERGWARVPMITSSSTSSSSARTTDGQVPASNKDKPKVVDSEMLLPNLMLGLPEQV